MEEQRTVQANRRKMAQQEDIRKWRSLEYFYQMRRKTYRASIKVTSHDEYRDTYTDVGYPDTDSDNSAFAVYARVQVGAWLEAKKREEYRESVRITGNRAKDMTFPEFLKYGMSSTVRAFLDDGSLAYTRQDMHVLHHDTMRHTLKSIPLGVSVNELIEHLQMVRGYSLKTGRGLKLTHFETDQHGVDFQFEVA